MLSFGHRSVPSVRRRVRRVGAARRAFTLLELLIALFILATMIAVMRPQLMARIREAKSSALGGNLRAINDAVALFRGNVGRYPSQLIHLTTLPASGALDVCGSAIPDAQLALWRGPYLSRALTSAGLPSGTATIQNTFLRRDLSSVTHSTLYVQVVNVDSAVVLDVDRVFDGDGVSTTGTIQWGAMSAGTATLNYHIPIRGC